MIILQASHNYGEFYASMFAIVKPPREKEAKMRGRHFNYYVNDLEHTEVWWGSFKLELII